MPFLFLHKNATGQTKASSEYLKRESAIWWKPPKRGLLYKRRVVLPFVFSKKPIEIAPKNVNKL